MWGQYEAWEACRQTLMSLQALSPENLLFAWRMAEVTGDYYQQWDTHALRCCEFCALLRYPGEEAGNQERLKIDE